MRTHYLRQAIYLFIAVLFIFAESLNAWCASIVPSTIITKLQQSCFTVMAKDEIGDAFATGSGFYINESGVGVTNFHVLEGASQGSIIDANGDEHQIKCIIDYNPDSDLIIFQVDTDKKVTYLNLSSITPSQGIEIISYGSPLGLDNSLSTGVISAIREDSHGEVIQITAPISHGSSGSPVVDYSGNVYGIATFGFTQGQNLNFAVSVKQLKELKRVLNIPLERMVRNDLETTNVHKATQLENGNHYEEAIELLVKEIEENPSNHLAFYKLGVLLCRIGDYSTGLSSLGRAIDLNETNWDYLVHFITFIRNLVVLLSETGDEIPAFAVQQAESVAELALSINPYRGEPMANLGYIYLYCATSREGVIDRNMMSKAKDCFDEAIRVSNDGETYVMRSEYHIKNGERDKALLDADIAVSLLPYSGEALSQRAAVRIYGYSLFDEGIADAERATLLHSRDSDVAEDYALIGDAYAKKALKITPSSADDFIKAINSYDKAEQTFPNRASVYDGYAKELMQSIIDYTANHSGYFPYYQGDSINYITIIDKTMSVVRKK